MRFHHGNDISSGRHEFQCDMQNVFVEKKHVFAMRIMICVLLAGGCWSQRTCISLRDGDNDISLQSGNAGNVVGMLGI